MAADPSPAPTRRSGAGPLTRWALLAVAGAMLATAYVPPAGVVLAGLALGVAIRALLLATRRHDRLLWPVVAVSIAPVVLLVAGVLSVLQVFFSDELGRYNACMAGANTRTSQGICQQELRDALSARL